MALTDAQCKAARPGPKSRKLSDGHGLYLEVLPTGTRSWRWKYRFAGREKKLVLGTYPLFSLKQARDLCDEARRKLAQGIDPGEDKQRARRKAAIGETFEEIARSWHAMKARSLTQRYSAQVLRRLETNVFRQFGGKPIREIGPPEVLAAIRRIEARGALTMAREIRCHVSDVFVWAISCDLAEHDPAATVRKALAPAPSGRFPALMTIAEAREALAQIEAVRQAHWSTRLAARLLALTAARPGMVRLAERGEFSGLGGPQPLWRVPAHKMKLSVSRKGNAAFDFVLPLAPQAAAVVAAAIAAGGASKLLFPAEASGQPMTDSTLSALFRDAGLRGRLVPHGWRATFSTIMNERAAEADRPGDRLVIDLMLAHAQSGVEPTYNRAAYMVRRRELACEWADLLLEGAAPPESVFTGPRRKNPGRKQA